MERAFWCRKILRNNVGMMILQQMPGAGGTLGGFSRFYRNALADMANIKGSAASTRHSRAAAKRQKVDEGISP